MDSVLQQAAVVFCKYEFCDSDAVEVKNCGCSDCLYNGVVSHIHYGTFRPCWPWRCQGVGPDGQCPMCAWLQTSKGRQALFSPWCSKDLRSPLDSRRKDILRGRTAARNSIKKHANTKFMSQLVREQKRAKVVSQELNAIGAESKALRNELGEAQTHSESIHVKLLNELGEARVHSESINVKLLEAKAQAAVSAQLEGILQAELCQERERGAEEKATMTLRIQELGDKVTALHAQLLDNLAKPSAPIELQRLHEVHSKGLLSMGDLCLLKHIGKKVDPKSRCGKTEETIADLAVLLANKLSRQDYTTVASVMRLPTFRWAQLQKQKSLLNFVLGINDHILHAVGAERYRKHWVLSMGDGSRVTRLIERYLGRLVGEEYPADVSQWPAQWAPVVPDDANAAVKYVHHVHERGRLSHEMMTEVLRCVDDPKVPILQLYPTSRQQLYPISTQLWVVVWTHLLLWRWKHGQHPQLRTRRHIGLPKATATTHRTLAHYCTMILCKT